MPTTLQGHGFSLLESDKYQVIAMGNSASGIEIYNQFKTTAVLNTYTFQHVTLHIINAIIGIPGSYSFGTKFMGLTQFVGLQNASGATNLDSQHGMTIFAPTDDAINAARPQMSSLSPATVFANHVCDLHTYRRRSLDTDKYLLGHSRAHGLVSYFSN